MITYEFAVLLGGVALLIYIASALFFKLSKSKIILGGVFIVYLTAVFAITLFPILLDEKIEYFGDITWYNFIPFKTVISMMSGGLNATAVIQIWGNICLTVPLGIFSMIFLKKHKWYKFLALGLLFAVSIEVLQLVIGLVIDNMYRTVDIDDVILNLTGFFIGCKIYKILPTCIKSL